LFLFSFWLRLGEQEKPGEGGKQEEEELFPFFFLFKELGRFFFGLGVFFLQGDGDSKC
jgi:hypothetical protein